MNARQSCSRFALRGGTIEVRAFEFRHSMGHSHGYSYGNASTSALIIAASI